MIYAATILDRTIKAVCPIHGVSVGRVDDKSTWRVDFADEATPEQCAAATKVLDGMDVDTLQRQLDLHAKVDVIESGCGMSRKERDLAVLLPDGAYLRGKAAKAESDIIASGIRS